MRRVHREGLDGTGDGNKAWRTAQRRKRPSVRPAMVETGVLFIGRGVAYRKMGLHRILFISTVDLLQPPRAPVHLPLISSNLHLRLFIHRLLFNHTSPRAPVQPPLHGHPSIVYCSSSPPHHGVMFIQRQRHRSLFIQTPPQHSLFIQRGNNDRLQLAAVAKESLDRVQLEPTPCTHVHTYTRETHIALPP